jgi:hypothetical protein
MAGEDSFPWDGDTVGDAASTDVWSAPYSAAEYADIYSKIYQSDTARGFVIPGYANNLEIVANNPVALNVLVKTGALTIRGRLYENTAQQTLTLGTADATNPRIDRIVARISLLSSVQTIRLVVLAGTAAATPSLPNLTQNSTTYEISLGYVWIAATATTIAATEIHDERIFAANLEALLTTLAQGNLLQNSEFMGFSRLGTVLSTNFGPPDAWTLVGTVTTWASATKPSQMSRGRAVAITAGAATSGMSQTFRAKSSTFYSFRTLINVTAGDVGVFKVTDNGGTPVTTTRNIRRTGSYIEETIYITTASDATTITVSVLANSNTDIVTIGQTLAAEGYLPGPYRQVRETIHFFKGIGDTSWDGTAKAAGVVTTTIDLASSFQALILPGTRAIRALMIINDLGTPAGPAVLSFIPDGGVATVSVINGVGKSSNASTYGHGEVIVSPTHKFIASTQGNNGPEASIRIMAIDI